MTYQEEHEQAMSLWPHLESFVISREYSLERRILNTPFSTTQQDQIQGIARDTIRIERALNPVPIPPSIGPAEILQIIKDNIEVKTQVSLNGTEVIVRTRLVAIDDEGGTVISEDEDSIDLEDLLDQL